MASTDFDVIIGSTKAKVVKTDGGGYTRRTVRREIENNLLTQSENPVLISRGDTPGLYQTSWASGARWWKPLITPDDLSSYFQANHMDTWSEPGKVVPGNKVADAANTNLHDNCVIAVGPSGIPYAIGATESTDDGFLDVYLWTPASDAFTRDTAQNSGVDDDDNPLSMVYDPTDGYFYIHTDDPEIVRFTAAGDDEDASWITTGFNAYPGSNIFLQNQNLMLYDGEKLYTINKSTPAVASAANDGMGPDFLNEASFAGTNPLFRKNIKLAISTPEGIYYVKNTRQGGQPVAWVFRVDKDAGGNWILNPIGNLPEGNVALSIAHHLGQVIIACTPDWQAALDNDTNEAEIVLYFMDEDGAGALGSILGGRDAMDETPYAMLGSTGPYLYIGGQKRLWVYDAVRGGLHTAWEWATALSNGAYVAMAWVQDSAGDSAQIFLGRDRIARTKVTKVDDPDTVAAFGDDETHYALTSNFFDFGLPMESKEITKVAILREPGDGQQEWTVQISADGGAFADALTHSTASDPHHEVSLSGTTGRKFQYRLIYQTQDTNRNALEALLVTATTGEQVTEWDLILDGTEFLNIDNEVQDEQTFYDAMKSLADTGTVTTLVDNMQEQGRETDSTTTTKVKVMAVEIVKRKAGESDAVRVVLRESA